VTNRKRWTIQEETELKALVNDNGSLEEIAGKLQKSPGSVIVKCQRLGLQLQTKDYVCTSLPMPRELPSVEEAAKMLASALRASVKPGLNRLEVQRLQVVANISKAYKELIVDYAHYHDVEIKLKEMIERYAQMEQTFKRFEQKSQNGTSERVSSPVE
jgi:hypothetical protein